MKGDSPRLSSGEACRFPSLAAEVEVTQTGNGFASALGKAGLDHPQIRVAWRGR